MELRFCTLALAASLLPVVAHAQTYRSIDDAVVNPAMSPATDSFLSLPGVHTDFVRAGGGQFVEFADGTAHLTFRVFSQSDLYAGFLVEVDLSGRLIPVDPGYPPANAPTQGLYANQYAPTGFIDTNTFTYYTSATAKLIGVRNLFGAVVELTASKPVQIGSGANNHNAHYGLFGDFTVNVLQHPNFSTLTPTGNATLALDFVNAYDEPTTHPQVYDQSLTPLTEGRGFTLPGVAEDYVFVPAANFREENDGTATLNGTLARLADLDDSWQVSLQFGGRVDPGQAAWPPGGSPVLQLVPGAYVAGGGTLDPDSWHYYTTVSGTLTGSGLNAGGVIDLTQTAAAQVGGGANNTNTYFGIYTSFATNIVSQPTARTLNVTADAELFALTAVFPVLPFPSLTVPATTPTHPTLSEQGLVLQGDNLAWVELVGVDFDLLGQGDENDFLGGWFRVLDNNRIEVHPRPDTLPGSHNMLAYNPAIQTNVVPVDLVEPTVPVLVGETSIGAGGTLHLRMHHGTIIGPALCLMGLSNTLQPSVYPGYVDLDIGAAFTDFALDPTLYSFDPQTNQASIDYGPISSSLLGTTYYFQAMVLDIGRGSPPFDETNYRQVDFQ